MSSTVASAPTRWITTAPCRISRQRIKTLLPPNATRASSPRAKLRLLMEAIERGSAEGRRTLGMAMEGGLGYVLTPKDEASLFDGMTLEESERLKGLDVTVLHSVILEHLLGLTGLDDISYTRNPLEAIRAADQGAAAVFLMNAPTVEDMRTIALGGERMPQKSTYYYPKIMSGLVMWSLNDF